MELSLSKLPWYGQVGAFVVVSAGAVFGFWNFYVTEMQADIDIAAGPARRDAAPTSRAGWRRRGGCPSSRRR